MAKMHDFSRFKRFIVIFRLVKDAERKQKTRAEFKVKMNKICEENPELSETLKKHTNETRGRPRIEADQPDLLAAIINIVQNNTTADERRRSECLRTVTTLSDLTEELKKLGHTLSRSAVYLRLVPRRGNTSEGQRHVNTVPVKLLRPEASLRKKNPDRMYAKSFVDDMFEVAKLFGPHAVLFMSNDDKCKVPLGLAAATLQAPLLMHLDYKVQLPDHSFAIGTAHKLIPSVYGVCNINQKGEVTYSGDTFIRIRSGKHDKSSAETHAYDMQQLFQTGQVTPKPILLLETDGAADEAPRYPKPLAAAIALFKQLNLDVLLHGVNASGLSAFNPIERRMAPLSHDLAGIILPHDTFGDHLDGNGKTIDIELERRNFKKAAEILAEVWSKTVIDGHNVDAQALPSGMEVEFEAVDQMWAKTHVQQSRYSLQIVKCDDEACCSKFTTDWMRVFPERFIPMPAAYKYGRCGMMAVEPAELAKNPKAHTYATLQQRILYKQLLPESARKYKDLPFDLYCPSMESKLAECLCKKCGQYWPFKAAVGRHMKCHKVTAAIIEQDDDDEAEEFDQQGDAQIDQNIPVFTDEVVSPFVEE